jgi:hypothetical protein
MLRVVQIGLKLSDLEILEQGTIIDMLTEAENDTCEYKEVATQEDFDRF